MTTTLVGNPPVGAVSTAAPTTVTLVNGPTIRIASVAGVAAPAAPTGSLTVPDIVLPGGTTGSVTVNLEAANIPLGTVISVTAKGQFGAATSATSGPLAGTVAASTASASIAIATNEASVISASASFSIVASAGGPVFVEGEEVERVRVTASSGGPRTWPMSRSPAARWLWPANDPAAVRDAHRAVRVGGGPSRGGRPSRRDEARMMRHRRGWLGLGLLVLLGLPAAEAQAGTVRYVNATDSTCGGDTPCSPTIQAAVTAAQSGDTIQIQAGTYAEQVVIAGKNSTSTASETDRIVIHADPAAPVGSVILNGAVTECTNGQAIELQQSKFITIWGLVITGAGGPAVSLLGGTHQNQAIHIERNRVKLVPHKAT